MRTVAGWALIASAIMLAGCRDEATEGPMQTGIAYLGNAFGEGESMVMFADDGQILELIPGSDEPQVAGEWMRRNGRFCMTEDPELTTTCLLETPFGNGGFALSDGSQRIELVPLGD